VGLLAGIFLVGSAAAQDINEAVTIEDLGFTMRMAQGARAAGMAGAFTSLGDDATALVFNPAGLARIRRIELGVGFQHQRSNLENQFFGSTSDVDVTSTDLDHVSWAYPVPTYRGSFVVGAGIYRVATSDIDILNRGFNASTASDDDYRLQQSGSVYSYNLGFGIDLSPVLSIGVNTFLVDGEITALTQFTYALMPPFANGDLTDETLVDNAKVDVDGYGAVLGLQYTPVPMAHFGLSVSTPTPLNLSGNAIQDLSSYYFNATDDLTTEEFSIDTDLQIPFRVDAGASITTDYGLVAVDVGYTDWTQATVNDIQLKDGNLQPVFRDVVDVRVGAEVSIPGTPVRVRGGYAYVPYALDFLQSDRIAGDAIEKAHVDTERQIIAGGVGALLGNTLNVDVALEFHLGQRSIPTLVDERKTKRFVMSAAYRF
jgi:hypothetical protein